MKQRTVRQIKKIIVAYVVGTFMSNVFAKDLSYAEKIYNEGVQYWIGRPHNKNELKACNLFKEAAKYNYSNALFNYAQCLREGVFGSKDIGLALEYYSRALNMGIDESAIAIAAVYLYEEKDKSKYNEARLLLLKHIDKYPKDSIANFSLGNIYYKGLGVSIDVDKAMKYYDASAMSGNTLAIALFYEVYKKGLNGYEVDRESSEIWKKLFEKINSLYNEEEQMSLQYALDKLYKEGWGLAIEK